MIDDDVNLLYKKMKEEISSYVYKEPGIILHAFSILLFLNQIGIEKMSRKDIVNSAKEYVKNTEIIISDTNDFDKFPSSSYASLGFYEVDSEEFKEILNSVKSATERDLRKKILESIKDSYQHLPDNVDLFLEKFSFFKNHNKILLITDIDIYDFSNHISQLQQPDIQKVMKFVLNIIQKYYEQCNNKDGITLWVSTFCIALQEVSENMPVFAGWRLKKFISTLEKYLSNMHNPQLALTP